MDWKSLKTRPFLPLSDLETFLGCSHSSLLRLIEDGQLPGTMKVRKQWRVPRLAVLNLYDGPAELRAQAELGLKPGRRPLRLVSVAHRWAVSVSTVERMIADGELTAFRLRRSMRVLWAEVARYERAAGTLAGAS